MTRLGWLLCLLALSCCSTLQVTGYYQVMDCCLRTSPYPIPIKVLRGYRDQQIQQGCPIRAVVFITVRGKQLCAPPHASWVKELKKRLDRRHKKQQQLLEVGACEDLLAHGGRCAEQRRLEAEMGLSQEANGQSSPLQGGELLVQSKRLDSGSWRMDFDSESNCEE
uniref:C-C motif chemokine 19-like n=1 Tax=Euleptes europaea TaxID=460621 RepID=UPI00253FAC39|nr:C-C motif chemokine 19-like [Euleptes europaea]